MARNCIRKNTDLRKESRQKTTRKGSRITAILTGEKGIRKLIFGLIKKMQVKGLRVGRNKGRGAGIEILLTNVEIPIYCQEYNENVKGLKEAT